MTEFIQDTIAAVSTPFGKGGVALVRISGPDAFSVASRVFLPKSGKAIAQIPERSAVYGAILSESQPIDDGLLTLFRAPRSYTGEDCAEISCHGGVLLTAKVLESVLCAGARPAQPGEFSKRAFLAGKLTLTGAEAVIDLINAESQEQLSLANANRRGALSQALRALYDESAALLAELYVTIDYPEEDLSELSDEELTEKISSLLRQTEALLETYRAGHAVAEGIRTVIVGKPNVGKSSFLNLLLQKDRAIVSPVAGTTRDTLEESATIGKVLLRLCDTAGLHKTDDPVEKLGVLRTGEKLAQAELVFALFDGSLPADEEDRRLIALLKERENYEKTVVVFLNKSDLPLRFDASLLEGFCVLPLCALGKEPPEGLSSRLEDLYATGLLVQSDRAILTNARQAASAKQARQGFAAALQAMDWKEGRVLACAELESASRALAAIDGQDVGEDIVSRIFSRFCVGK